MGLRLLNHHDDAPKGGLRSYVLCSHTKTAKRGNCCRKDPAASMHFDWHGLTSDRRLVHRRLHTKDLAIDRDRLPRTDKNDLSDVDLGNGNHLLFPVTFHPCSLWIKRRKSLDGLP